MTPQDQEKYDEAMGEFIEEDFSFQKELGYLRMLPVALLLPFFSIPIGKERQNSRVPWITISLIAVNIIVFLILSTFSDSSLENFYEKYAFSPHLSQSLPNAYRFITSMFLHLGFLHIFGNMLFLWIFGSVCEDIMSGAEFFCYYMITGIAGSIALAMFTPEFSAIGASGAISGIMGMCLILLPNAKIFLLGSGEQPLIPVSLWYYVFVWTSLQVYEAYTQTNPGIGYAAHFGSLLTGVVISLLLKTTGSLLLKREKQESTII